MRCGNICKVSSKNLKNNHTSSCGCINYSIGEQNIINVLKHNNIDFIKEYTFINLPNRRYDFYLPNYNRLIEFDGRQHTEMVSWYKTLEEFKQAKIRDQEKNDFALQNNIDLIRIPFTERDNISLELLLGNKYLIKEGE